MRAGHDQCRRGTPAAGGSRPSDPWEGGQGGMGGVLGWDRRRLRAVRAALTQAPSLAVASGLVDDQADPVGPPVAVLVLATADSVHCADRFPGAEPVDVVISGLLAAGFVLLPEPDSSYLLGLEPLPGWRPRLHGDHLQVRALVGEFYQGRVDDQVPVAWRRALRAHARLLVLVGSDTDLHSGERIGQLRRAAARGGLLAASMAAAEA